MNPNLTLQIISVVSLCLLCSTSARADFVLDFMPDDGGGISKDFTQGNFSVTGTTPFLMRGSLQLPEIVTDPETGLSYFHIIMGDPTSGFAQEVYIQRGFGSFQGGPGSAVGGGGFGDNNVTPLGPNAGNGEANPRKVLVRQIVSDGEIYIDFTKDKFDRKPKITQMLTLPSLTSLFQLDMSNSSYGDNTTPGILSYTLNLADDYQGSGQFNFATDVQNSTIEGGRFTYTDGSGPGGSAGTYTYEQGSFNVDAITWEAYFDHSLTNQWGYTQNRPMPP